MAGVSRLTEQRAATDGRAARVERLFTSCPSHLPALSRQTRGLGEHLLLENETLPPTHVAVA